MITKFAFPTTIHFGPGARKLVAEHLKQQGLKRPLIVTDRGLGTLPILHDFAESLDGLEVKVFAGGVSRSMMLVTSFPVWASQNRPFPKLVSKLSVPIFSGNV